MAGKNSRKQHLPSGDTQETSEGGVDERSMLEIFICNQQKRDEEAEARTEARRLREKKEQLEAEERAEERKLKAEIAAEERDERRKERARVLEAERVAKAKVLEAELAEKAKIAEEERIEARALEKERRKLEESRRQEELLRRSEELTRKAAEKAAELQEEATQRALEQQKELLELQAELGRKASEAQRAESQKVRQKDRAVASVTAWQRGEDIEDFLLSSERKLRAGGIPEDEWLGVVASKLSGEIGATWQELCLGSDDYQEVRGAVLMGCGYTQKAAGEAYHAFRVDSLKGMSADQVFRKGLQLLRRMIAPKILDKETEFLLVKPWVYACVGRRARSVLEARVVETAEDLVKGLQDYLASDGDRLSGRVAVFGSEGGSRRPTYGVGSGPEPGKAGSAGSSGGSSLICFHCGKAGHKAADCWQRAKPEAGAAEGASKIICFICGVEGHKATTCPGKKEAHKGANVKLIQQVRLGKEYDTVVGGKVNGWGANLVLDSGAHVTVVPEDMVAEKWKTGELVELRGYQAITSFRAPMAKVKFCVEGLADWEEIVALAPAEEGRENEVILRLELRTDRGRRLVELARGLHEAKEGGKGKSEKEGDFGKKENLRIGVVTVVKSVEKDVVKAPVKSLIEPVWPPVSRAVAGRGGAKAVVTAKPKVQKAQKKKLEVKKLEVLSVDKILGTGDGGLTADRPVRNPEPVASDESRRKDEWPDWSGSVESYVGKTVVIERRDSLKPVRALEVVMRASAVEQARLVKLDKARMKKTRKKWQGKPVMPDADVEKESHVPALKSRVKEVYIPY